MGHTKSLQLFCTRADLLAVLASLETTGDLRYAQCGLFDDKHVPIFSSAFEIENLGTSAYGDCAKDPAYVVFRLGTQLKIRSVPQKEGGVMYAVDQGENPNSITLKSGGLYRGSCVIAGQAGTVSNSNDSVLLYGQLQNNIRSSFKKIKSYWVGPEAIALWKSGFRLTSGVNMPRSYDLSSVSDV